MPKITLTLIVSFLLTGAAHAQKGRFEDVVRLANGWIIRGTILDRTDSSVHIRTSDGNVFVFASNEVRAITREAAWSMQARSNHPWISYTELGPLIAGRTTVDGVTTAAFSFQTLIGYSFHSTSQRPNSVAAASPARPSLTPLVGAGADLYATQTIIPLFGSLRANLLRSAGSILYCFGDGGYGINITQRAEPNSAYKGGILYAAGLGIRIPFTNNAGFLLSLAYRYQKTNVTTNGIPGDIIYRRLALRAGFYL